MDRTQQSKLQDSAFLLSQACHKRQSCTRADGRQDTQPQKMISTTLVETQTNDSAKQLLFDNDVVIRNKVMKLLDLDQDSLRFEIVARTFAGSAAQNLRFTSFDKYETAFRNGGLGSIVNVCRDVFLGTPLEAISVHGIVRALACCDIEQLSLIQDEMLKIFNWNIFADPFQNNRTLQVHGNTGAYELKMGMDGEVYCACQAWAIGSGKGEMLCASIKSCKHLVARFGEQEALRVLLGHIRTFFDVKSRLERFGLDIANYMNPKAPPEYVAQCKKAIKSNKAPKKSPTTPPPQEAPVVHDMLTPPPSPLNSLDKQLMERRQKMMSKEAPVFSAATGQFQRWIDVTKTRNDFVGTSSSEIITPFTRYQNVPQTWKSLEVHSSVEKRAKTMLLSEKLDGIRAVWNPLQKCFRTRNGIAFTPEFAGSMPPYALDGEIFPSHGISRSQVFDRCKKGLWEGLTFGVFDVIMDGMSAQRRYEFLLNHVACVTSLPSCVKILNQIKVESISHARTCFDQIRAAGGEGIVLKSQADLYHAENSRIKWKGVAEDECILVARNAGLSATVFWPAHKELFNLKVDNSCKVLDIINFKYRDVTVNNKPSQPTFVCVRQDLDKEDFVKKHGWNNWYSLINSLEK